jgi:hypothetical protein
LYLIVSHIGHRTDGKIGQGIDPKAYPSRYKNENEEFVGNAPLNDPI